MPISEMDPDVGAHAGQSCVMAQLAVDFLDGVKAIGMKGGGEDGMVKRPGEDGSKRTVEYFVPEPHRDLMPGFRAVAMLEPEPEATFTGGTCIIHFQGAGFGEGISIDGENGAVLAGGLVQDCAGFFVVQRPASHCYASNLSIKATVSRASAIFCSMRWINSDVVMDLPLVFIFAERQNFYFN